MSHEGTVDKYTITYSRPIGRGAFGTVYHGTDNGTGEKIAAKQIIIDGNQEMFKMAKQEMEFIRGLQNHKNIVKLYGHSFTSELGWIFLEYCDLGNLNVFLKKNRNLDIDRKVQIMYQSASAVEFMHGQNPPIIHRDIKPENILLKEENGESTVKFSDFGVSRLLDENTMMSTHCGTQYFMAPELSVDAGGIKYDSSVDVFALGLVNMVILQSGSQPDLIPLSVDARKVGNKISIGKEMLSSASHDKPRPTVVEVKMEDDTITRRLKRIIVCMTKYNATDRTNTTKIKEDLYDIQSDSEASAYQQSEVQQLRHKLITMESEKGRMETVIEQLLGEQDKLRGRLATTERIMEDQEHLRMQLETTEIKIAELQQEKAMFKRRESAMQCENEGLKERIRLSKDEYQTKASAMTRENEDLKERIRKSQDEYRTKYLECNRLQSRLQQSNERNTDDILNDDKTKLDDVVLEATTRPSYNVRQTHTSTSTSKTDASMTCKKEKGTQAESESRDVDPRSSSSEPSIQPTKPKSASSSAISSTPFASSAFGGYLPTARFRGINRNGEDTYRYPIQVYPRGYAKK